MDGETNVSVGVKWKVEETRARRVRLGAGSDHDFGEIAGSFFRGVVIRSTLLQQLDESRWNMNL
jgi:hypothetical protein